MAHALLAMVNPVFRPVHPDAYDTSRGTHQRSVFEGIDYQRIKSITFVNRMEFYHFCFSVLFVDSENMFTIA